MQADLSFQSLFNMPKGMKACSSKFMRINASGKLSDARFDMMRQTYEAEQRELEAEVIRLRGQAAAVSQDPVLQR